MPDDITRLNSALGGRYRIQRQLGMGGMATVYLAEDPKRGRMVAVKVLKPALSATVGTDRFLREIEVTAKLQHPNVLTLIDSGEVDGLPYYVMPFVDGQSLRERMETEGQFPVEEAVRIAREIADGLARAHAQGVIHRDVKPSNVLLSSGHAIVADFGIAAALDEAAVSRLTDTGVSLGSPAYMSPEQASGETDMDPRTDVYALGCVLYEMLGGKAAFAGSMRTLLTQKVLGKIEPLQELRPDVPPPIVDAVARAMATEPADRFPSAEAFSDALLAGIAKTGVGATARPWMIASAAAVVIVAAAALVMVQGIQGRSERALLVAQQLAEVEDLVEAGHYVEALILA